MKIKQTIEIDSEITPLKEINLDDLKNFKIYFDISGNGLYYQDEIFDVIGIDSSMIFGSEENESKEFNDWKNNFINKIDCLYLGKCEPYSGINKFNEFYPLADVHLDIMDDIKKFIKQELIKYEETK